MKPANQCTLDGSPFSLVFDGTTLSGNGFSATAASGVPREKNLGEWKDEYGPIGRGGDIVEKTFDYSEKAQSTEGAGPITKGSYWLDLCEGRNIFSNGKGFPASKDHTLGHESWGFFSWSLHSDVPQKRNGFFIHGGIQFGSLGCIDIKDNDIVLAGVMSKLKKECDCCYVPVIVRYDVSKVTIIDRIVTWTRVPDTFWQ